MAWKVFGERFNDLSGVEACQKFKAPDNFFLRGSQHWLIFLDSPVWTELSMSIYSDRNGSPGVEIKKSSKTWTAAQIIADGVQLEGGAAFTALRNGNIKLYFDWDDFQLRKDLFYHFVLQATGYAGTAAKHIAWRKAWPDPAYRTGVTTTIISQGKDPLSVEGIVGSVI